MRFTADKSVRAGFSLVEILITLAILGILVMIAVGNFGGVNEKYKVESETKQLYADLMDARGRAMQRNRVSFVRIDGVVYQTYEDTTPAPDGDGTLQQGTDRGVANMTVSHAIDTSNIAAAPLVFNFNRNGIASVTGYLRFSSAVKPDYDCITINPTRIKMGQFSGGVCVEK